MNCQCRSRISGMVSTIGKGHSTGFCSSNSVPVLIGPQTIVILCEACIRYCYDDSFLAEVKPLTKLEYSQLNTRHQKTQIREVKLQLTETDILFLKTLGILWIKGEEK